MKQFLCTKKKYIWVTILSVVVCFFFFTVPAFAASDEEIKNVLIENYDIFQNNNIFVSAIRWIGWLIVSGLSWVGASCAELFDKAFLFVDFTQDPQIKEYIETFDLVFTALICLSLVALGIILIFWHEKKPKFAMNLLIAVLVVSSGSEILYQMNQFLAEDVRGQILGTEENTSADMIYEMVGSSVYDLKMMDRDIGLMNLTIENRTTLPKLSKRDIALIDINEILKPEDVGDDAKDLMEQRLDVYAGEEADKAQLREVYNGVAWTDLLNEYYYRYNVNWVLCIVGMIATILVYICMAYKVVRILYEIVIHQIMAILYSANLSNSQKTFKILDGIKDSYITLILVLICVKIYHIAYYFINNLDVGGFTKAFMLLFVALAVADGPNIIQKITGIDAGLSSEFGKFLALMQASRVVKDVTRGIARGASRIGGAIGNAMGQGNASDVFEPNADYQNGLGGDDMPFQNDPNNPNNPNDPNHPNSPNGTNDPNSPNGTNDSSRASFGTMGGATSDPFHTPEEMGNVPPDPSPKAEFNGSKMGGNHTVNAGDNHNVKDAVLGAAVGATLASQGKSENQPKEVSKMNSDSKEKEANQKQGKAFPDGSGYNPEKDSQEPYGNAKRSDALYDTVDNGGLGTQPYDADLDRMEEEIGQGFQTMEEETLGSEMPIYGGGFMENPENMMGMSGDAMDDFVSEENGFQSTSLEEAAADSFTDDFAQESSEVGDLVSTGAEEIGSFAGSDFEESGTMIPGTEALGTEALGMETVGADTVRAETVGTEIAGSEQLGSPMSKTDFEQGEFTQKEPLQEEKANQESDHAGMKATGVVSESSVSGKIEHPVEDKMEVSSSEKVDHLTGEKNTVKQETSSKGDAFEKQKEIGSVGSNVPVGGDSISKKQAFDAKPPIQATEKVIEKQAQAKPTISKEQPLKKDISEKGKTGRSKKGKGKKSDLL